eukprot:gene9619-12953_t
MDVDSLHHISNWRTVPPLTLIDSNENEYSTIISNRKLHHLVMLSDKIEDRKPFFCHIYLPGTGCEPLGHNCATWWLSSNLYTVENDEKEKPEKNLVELSASIGLSYEYGQYADSKRNEIFIGDSLNNDELQAKLENYHSAITYGGVITYSGNDFNNDNQMNEKTECKIFISKANSIMGRLVSLIYHLKSTSDPKERWSELLVDPNAIETEDLTEVLRYDRIILSGHSQGAGHACYLAKKHPFAKVILLSGPQEALLNTNDVRKLTNSDNDGNNHKLERDSNVNESLSWMDGSYATSNMVALMHNNEEGTAELIRSNWNRIEPLRIRPSYGIVIINNFVSSPVDDFNIQTMGNPRKIESESAIAEYVDDRFIRKFITFYSANNELLTARPLHNSTVVDSFTPRIRNWNNNIESVISKQLNIHEDHVDVIKNVIFELDFSQFHSNHPIYHNTIWKKLIQL